MLSTGRCVEKNFGIFLDVYAATHILLFDFLFPSALLNVKRTHNSRIRAEDVCTFFVHIWRLSCRLCFRGKVENNNLDASVRILKVSFLHTLTCLCCLTRNIPVNTYF